MASEEGGLERASARRDKPAASASGKPPREGAGKQSRVAQEGAEDAEPQPRTVAATGEGEGEGVAQGSAAADAAPRGPQAQPAATTPATITTQTDQQAPDGSAETRRTVAVGELVYFSADTTGPNARWSTSGGRGQTNTDGTYNWTAPAAPGSVTVTFTPGDGRAPTTVTMTVVGVSSIRYFGQQRTLSGTGRAGMTVQLEFLPLSVCFWGTEWRETVVPATGASGFFETAPPGDHQPSAPRAIGSNNRGPGDRITYQGTGPFSTGSFTWAIPQQYGVTGSNTWHDIATFDQITRMTAAGRVTITKNGATTTS